MNQPVVGLGVPQQPNVDDARIRMLAELPVFTLFQHMASSPRGLTEAQAAERLREYGENEPFHAPEIGFGQRMSAAVRSPFVVLLAALGAVLLAIGDRGAAGTVVIMVVLAVALRVWQQTRSVRATRALREVVCATVTVRRRAGDDTEPLHREVPVHDVVPGDVVTLCAGDVVPADVRILASTNLAVDQAALSGEALPVSKAASEQRPHWESVVDTPSLCFAGTAVVAGKASAVVIATGEHTYFGSLAQRAADARPETAFDSGVRKVGWTLIQFMLVLAPIVFVVNGAINGVWAQAAMFAVAVAVALTPEMLPVIVTTNLARGAVRLARDKVIVSRLNAIQDLGAVDVLCTDKTGTLTEDRVVYAHSVDITGRIDDGVAEFAYLAVHFSEGTPDRLDEAITEVLASPDMVLLADAAFERVDEVGFDHARRRHTVVVTRQRGQHMLICKGDPDQVLARCAQVRLGEQTADFDDQLRAEADDLVRSYHRNGMRVLAVAIRENPARLERYGEPDEQDLVLAGFVGFVDPIRDSAAAAVARLSEHGVAVKMLTGDSKAVAVQVARQVGIDATAAVRGKQLDALSTRKLRIMVARCSVFAELTPMHKTRIVAALREEGHAVGFLGDGVNDVPALRIADAGIAANTATEVAKQAADLILLDTDLAVVARGVVEGRRTLANTMKYVKITASSNFGNVLSVLAASVVLPFLPMLPVQLMVQNLLYDVAQLTLPWDRVDADYLRSPRRWQQSGLTRFMLVFGTLSSIFDLATFAVLWWVFGAGQHPAVFQTGWFIEGLLTQLLVVMVLRARSLPWRGARAAKVVVLAALTAGAVGVLLPLTPLAHGLSMAALPPAYWLWMIAVVSGYGTAAHLVKKQYMRHRRIWM